jgi:hypothetical protein
MGLCGDEISLFFRAGFAAFRYGVGQSSVPAAPQTVGIASGTLRLKPFLCSISRITGSLTLHVQQAVN